MTDGMLRVVFRTDASTGIGTGHVMRCLNLARGLAEQGARVEFVTREHDGHLCALIERQGFAVHRLQRKADDRVSPDDPVPHAAWIGTDWREDADETLAAIGGLRVDWLIVDHYGLDARWQSALRSAAKRIMVVDDLADRVHDCDLLLDQNLVEEPLRRYSGKVPGSCVLLLGPAYGLLGADYARLRDKARIRSGAVRRLLVSFGGIDRDELTLKTVDGLLSLQLPDLEADIVLSSTSPQFSTVRDRVEGQANLRLHDRVPSLAPLICEADLAIGASGGTNWERLCLGLPALVVTVAENQIPLASELSRRGLVQWLGQADGVSQGDIGSALRRVIARGLDPSWSKSCFEVVDGRGVERVGAALLAGPRMPLVIRDAGPADEALLLEWANDPVTRANGFSTRRITPDEHHRWFQARLGQKDTCAFYVAETEKGVPVGQIRFDDRTTDWEISYALAPPFRGRGLGRRMLDLAIQHWRSIYPGASLIGQVKPENIASRKIFDALGFSVRTAASDRYVFERYFEK